MTAASTGTTPTPLEAREASPAGWDHVRPASRYGWAFAAVWLVYLLEPLREAWTSSSVSLPWRVLTIVALLSFAAGFIWFFVRWRVRRIHRGTPLRTAEVLRVLAAGALLLVLAAPGGGEDVLNGLIYVGVAAAMTLRPRQTLLVVLVLIAAVLGLPRVVPGWVPVDGFVPELALACFAAFGVGQVIERNSQLARAREQLVDLAVTRERERLGRDVHDILGHSLTVITVKSELAGRLVEMLPPGPAVDRVRAEVADVERLAREALADVRATVSGMRELSLTGELAAAREALAAAGIRAELPTAVDDVPSENRELFAWALREGVTNVVRHSGAARCVVRLAPDCLEVVDDGSGPVPGHGDGTGLAGLRARASAAGAEVETGPATEGGFRLQVRVGRSRRGRRG